MKKILLIGLISSLFSAGAFAAACTATATTGPQAGAAGSATPVTGEQCVCDGGNAFKNTINGGAGIAVGTPLFVKTGFNVQCSAHTIVSYNEVSSNGFAVASGSKKGNQTFIGSTTGGGISVSASCASSGCVATDVTTANGLATTAAAGS